MTDFDFEDGFEGEQEQDEGIDELDELLDEIDAEDLGVDPQRMITIRTTSGGATSIPVAEGETLSIADALDRANLTATRDVEYYVGGEPREADFQVAGGASITAVGTVKGG
jgi:hypothetical protein